MARRGKNDEMVITVGIQASDTTKPVFDLTAKNAEKLGKAIGNAFAIDTQKTRQSLNTVNEDLKRMAVQATKVKNAFSGISDFNYKQANRNIQSIAKELGSLETRAKNTTKTLRDVKFIIGDSNRNIKSVISQLERLESVAKRIGTQKINLGVASVGGTTRSSSSSGSSNKTTTTSSPTIGGSNRGVYYGGYGPNIPSYQEKQNELNRTSKTRQGVGQSTFIPDNYFKEMEKQSAEAGKKVAQNLSKGFNTSSTSFLREIDNLGQKANSRFSRLFSANFFADIAYNTMQSTVNALQTVSVETVKYAARTQELGIVLDSLAKVNNISTQSIIEQEQAIKNLNITTQDTRETLARFIAVGFDVKSAGPLARVAQDLAVLSGKNTSEALDGLVVAIQTLQSRNLRSAGVYITVDEVLDRLSNTTGRARDSFSTLEKQQAVLNAVMEYGNRVAGTYEASMTSVSKQLRSMERLFFEAQNAIGTGFIPVMELAVTGASSLLETIAQYPGIFSRLVPTILAAGVALVAFKTQLIQTSVASIMNIGSDFKSLLANGTTVQSQTNALKAQAIQLDLRSLNLQIQKLDVEIVTLSQQGKKNALLVAEANIRRQMLVNQESQLGMQAASNAKGSSFATTIGRVAVIGTVALVLYDIVQAIRDINSAPIPLKSFDLNAAIKTNNELEKTKALRNEAINIENQLKGIDTSRIDSVANQISLENQRLKIAKSLGIEGQAYLGVLEQQGKLTGSITEAVNIQIRTLENKRKSDLDKGVLNLRNAAANLGAVTGGTTSERERITVLENLLQQAKESGFTPNISEQNPFTGYIGSAIRYLKPLVTSEEAGILSTTIKSGNRGIETQSQIQQAAAELVLTYKEMGVTYDEIAKKEADLTNSFETLFSLSENYGISADEMYQRAIEGLSAESREVKLLTDAYHNLILVKKEQIDDSFLTPEDTLYKQATRLSGLRDKAVVNEYNRMLTERKVGISRGDDVSKYDGLIGNQSDSEYIQKRYRAAIKAAEQTFGRGQSGDQERSIFRGVVANALSLEEEGAGRTFSAEEKLQRIIALSKEYGKLPEYQDLDKTLGLTDNATKNLNLTTQALTKFSDTVEDKFNKAMLQLYQARSSDSGTLNKFFEAETLEEEYSMLNRVLKLQYQLTGNTRINADSIKDFASLKLTLDNLERQQKIEDAIKSAKNAQRDIEDEIAILKVTSTLPAINAELLLQKQVLDNVKERRDAEQKLTADIAFEINKREKYAVDSASEINRVTAEFFLDSQRKERQEQEDAFKGVLGLALQTGNTSSFENNPLIREAVKQADSLKELDKKGGLQVAKIEESKQVLIQSYNLELDTNRKIGNLAGEIGTEVAKAIPQSQADYSNNSSDFGSYATGNTKFDRIFNAFVGQESGGDFRARNGRTSATGLTQIVPKFFQSYANLAGLPHITFEQYRTNPQVQRAIGYRSMEKLFGQATAMSGGDENLAIKMLASRWYSGSFHKYNQTGRSRAMAAHNEPSIAEYANSVLSRVRTGKKYVSPTQGVTNNIQASIVSQPQSKPNYVELSPHQFGLTKSEFDAVIATLGTNGKFAYDEAIAALGQAQLFKQFGGNATAKGDTAIGIGNAAGNISGRLKNIAVRTAELDTEDYNKNLIRELEIQEQLIKVREINQDIGRAFNLNADLDSVDSAARKQAIAEADLSIVQKSIDLKKEEINLSREAFFRETNYRQYVGDQLRQFNNEQEKQRQDLQNSNEQLYLREKEYLNENSQLRKNIIEEEKRARREAVQSLTEEIDAVKRYNAEYLFSTDNRVRLTRELERDRLKEVTDVNEEIIRSQIRVNNITENLDLRLAAKRQQILEEQARRREDSLMRQVELEMEYERIRNEGFNSTEFRNTVLDKIVGETKSTTELMANLWTDSFDAINQGFGSLIDKGMSKMGIFGQTIGNLLKGIFNNITGSLFSKMLNLNSPTAVGGILSGATPGFNSEASNPIKDMLGIAGPSSDAGSAIMYLAQASAMAAQALIGIAGTVGTTAVGIVGAVNSIRIGGGASGGRFGGVSTVGGGGAGGGGIFNAMGAIQSATTSGGASIAGIVNMINSSAPNAPTIFSGSTVSGSGGNGALTGLSNTIHESMHSIAGNAGKGGGFRQLLGGLGIDFKGMGTNLLASLPMLGSSLGGYLGRGSTTGSILGQVGGLVGGGVGLGVIGAVAGSTGLGGIFGSGGALAAFGGLSAATLGIGAAIAGAFMLGSYLIGRNARRRKEEKVRNEAMLQALPALEELLKGVQTDKINGDEALSRAAEIRQQYITEMSKLKDKKTRNIALKDVSRLDAIIDRIKIAARNQEIRRETNDSIVPTYASGGVASGSLIRVSKGETLYAPSSLATMSGAFAHAGIPGFASGGISSRSRGYKIPGTFDGKDNIYMRVPVGTVIANPAQESKIKARGYASGGIHGNISAPAAQAGMTHAPSVTVINVMSEEEATKLAGLIPNAQIANKLGTHIDETGTSGIVGKILNTMTS